MQRGLSLSARRSRAIVHIAFPSPPWASSGRSESGPPMRVPVSPRDRLSVAFISLSVHAYYWPIRSVGTMSGAPAVTGPSRLNAGQADIATILVVDTNLV